MCESKVYVVEDGDMKLLAEDVVYLKKEGDTYVIVNLQGERITLTNYVLRDIDFLSHKVVFARG
ncbi:RNA-binding protein [Candidatus Geothermarchaeota archaeon ex4572_27]|nr:MAG: RNA-binding protein [Candidatus Geothermarchaeota archaeon ex4572_27]